MGLYGFHKRFVAAIQDGSKTHTIRSRRAHPDKPGNILHLYTGLRRKGAKLLMRVPCTRIQEISMIVDSSGQCQVYIDGIQLAPDEREQLAKRDGFADWKIDDPVVERSLSIPRPHHSLEPGGTH